MAQILIGEIKQINRYPIKSFGGERLHRTRIEPYGLYGDRSHAFIDETKAGWDRYITAREIPKLLGFKAEFAGKGNSDEFPQVKITSPNGEVYDWGDHLLSEIQSCTATKITMLRLKPQSIGNLAVDTGSILFITDDALGKLEKIWGNSLDPRRFRANFLVSLSDGITFDKTNFLDKHLVINNAEFHINMPCERCSIITLDPDHMKRDSSLLKKVTEEMNLNFGVYASVLKTGEVNLGDKIYMQI